MEPLADTCPYCHRQFVYAARLVRHVKSDHRELYAHFVRLYDLSVELRLREGPKRPRFDSEEPQTVPVNSDEEFESDSSTGDREDLNPRAGELSARQEKTQTDAGRTYDSEPEPDDVDGSSERDPWAPFSCEEDFRLGQWFVEHRISQAAIEDYFRMARRFPDKFYQGSFTSAYTLFKAIDKMTYDVGWSDWKEGSVCHRLPEDIEGTTVDSLDPRDDTHVSFFYRNPLDCVKFIMRQPRLDGKFVYEPYKDFNEQGDRVYGEMHTADWWWKAQVGHLTA
jgi:hypothetical protein